MSLFRDGSPETDVIFARLFKEARERAHLTQDEVASDMTTRGFGFHQATVYKIEAGSRKVSIAEAAALADVVGMPLAVLLVNPSGDTRSRLAGEARRLYEEVLELREILGSVADRLVSLEAEARGWDAQHAGEDYHEGVSALEYFAPLLRLQAQPLLEQLEQHEDEAALRLARGIGAWIELPRG